MKIYQWIIYDRAENWFDIVQGTDLEEVCEETYKVYMSKVEELREQNDLEEEDTDMVDDASWFANEHLEYWIARRYDLHIVAKSNFFEVSKC